MSRAPGGAVLAAAGIAAEYGGELYPRTCPARSSTPLLAGEAGISATLESGRTMSWATPVRSHVVVTMMARSITVERSVPALLGLARVSGLGAARHGVFHLSGLEGGPPRILSRWGFGFCEEGRSSNASQFARDADADAAAGTTAAAGRAAAPASGRIEPARREGADLTRPTGRPRRRAHVALSKPSATPLRLPSRRLPCSLVAQAIDS